MIGRKQEFLRPRNGIELDLKDAANGSMTFYYDPKIYSGEDYKDQMGNAYEDALHRYHELQGHAFIEMDLMVTEKPFMTEDGQWVVITCATEHYKPCAEHLSHYVTWNVKQQKPAWDETINSLQSMLRGRHIHEDIFSMLAGARYPQLDGIKKELMLWKLRAELVNGYWSQ